MDMNVTETGDGVTQVMLDGRFDIAGAQEVDSRFLALAETAKLLVVDLTNVSFIASLGVRTLMMSAKAVMRRGADMAVCGASENVKKVLHSTGFDEVAGIYPDFAAASAAVLARSEDFASRKS
jgi:anti-anti-sigma factor